MSEVIKNKDATDIMNSQIVDYENMMREGGESVKSGNLLGWATGEASDGIGVWESEIKAFMDAYTLKQLFFTEDWVYICVDAVALKISGQQLRVMRGEVVDGTLQKKPAEGHPLQAIIEYPNAFQAYHSWMYCSVVDLCLIGNAIQWYSKTNKTIMNLPAESTTLEIGKNGKINGYKVSEGNPEDVLAKRENSTMFSADQIMHMRKPNPSSLLWGLSPFIPGRKSILFNRYSSDYLNSFYQKGAIPGFALEMDKEANERVAMRLLRSFENAYTGRRNMRRTLILPKGVTLKEVSHTLVNQDLATYIDLNREVIINLLKVPKHELGLQDAGSLGSEETKSSLKNFWYATLIPLMKIIESEMTQFFTKQGLLGENHFLEFDLSNIDALAEDESQKATLATNMLKTHTLNEVRKKLYNLPALPDGDVVQGFGTPLPSFSPFGQMSFQPQQQPQLLEITAPAESPVVEVLDAKPEKVKAPKDTLDLYLKGKDNWFDQRERKVRDNVAKAVGEVEKRTLTLFADMASEVVRVTRNYLKEKDYQVVQTKADAQSKIVKRAELRRRLRAALGKFEEKYVDDHREILTSRVDLGYSAALEVPFNMPSKTEIEGLRARGAAARQDALEERSARVFSYLNETTLGQVFDTIEGGIDKGRTVQEIAGDLRSRFSDIAEIGSRAMTIARTETLTAVSLGQAAAMKDAAQVIPNLKKMWITANDDRVRETHIELHGDIVAWDGVFDNNLGFPRDPSGPAGEVINCRCTWIMLPEEQMSEINPGLRADEG